MAALEAGGEFDKVLQMEVAVGSRPFDVTVVPKGALQEEDFSFERSVAGKKPGSCIGAVGQQRRHHIAGDR